MRYVFALLAVVSTCSILPASSQECEPEISLASLDGAYTVGSVQHRVELDRSTASIKEGEFEPQRRLQPSRQIARIESGPWSLIANLLQGWFGG